MELSARVRHEQILAPVEAVVARRRSHAGVGVVDADGPPALLEPEAETGGVGGLGDVQVQPVRIEVVRDVEVETAVRVDVREDRSQAVVDVCGLEAGALSDLTEARAAVPVHALVEVEAVSHAGVVAGEPACRSGDRRVGVGVAGDEQVRPSVAVHVADRGARMPARRVDPRRPRAFRESAVAVSPEERVVAVGGDVVAGSRHVEVGVAVQVEVGRDAAVAAKLQVCARAAAHVDELPADVVEQGTAGQATVLRPAHVVLVRVGVDDEQVEPAVGVVVDPAQAGAHHRLGLVVDAEAERALREVEPHLSGDVVQFDPAQGLGPGRRRDGCFRHSRPPDEGDQIAAVLESEVDRAREAHRCFTLGDGRRGSRVGHEGDGSGHPSHDCRRRLARGGREGDANTVDAVLRDDDGAAVRRLDLAPDRREADAVRAGGRSAGVAAAQRVRLDLKIGHDIPGDLLCLGVVDGCDAR